MPMQVWSKDKVLSPPQRFSLSGGIFQPPLAVVPLPLSPEPLWPQSCSTWTRDIFNALNVTAPPMCQALCHARVTYKSAERPSLTGGYFIKTKTNRGPRSEGQGSRNPNGKLWLADVTHREGSTLRRGGGRRWAGRGEREKGGAPGRGTAVYTGPEVSESQPSVGKTIEPSGSKKRKGPVRRPKRSYHRRS